MPGGEAVDADDRARLAAAFDGWLDAQRSARDWMLAADVPHTAQDLAEGYRWVTRLASLAQEWFVEKNDPLHPELFVSQTPFRKLMVDNPDVTYWFCALDGSRTYRLTGTRGDAAYVGLTFGTPVGKGALGGRTGTLAQVHLDNFETGPDGQVDLWLSPVRPDGVTNWIELDPECGQVAVRETFHDRSTQRPSQLRIDLVDDVAPPRCTADDLVPQLEFASLFLAFVGHACTEIWNGAEANLNHFGGTSGRAHVEAQDSELRSHSDADMTYHGGLFRLGPGEALEVTVQEPERPFTYWGLTVTNPWMESYDGRYSTTHLNDRTAQRSADGSWRLVIAPEDPGVANWIDTGGRREGYMLVRWVLADDPPHPTARVIPLRP
jgi:hypothetical protein